MANEIELKLEVTPAQLTQLKRAPWLAKYATSPGKDQQLVSVYYDTDDLVLRERHAIFRVRDADGRFVQTFKREGQGSDSGLARLEWERPLRGPKPSFRHARKKRAGGLDLKAIAGELKPVFETVVRRHTFALHYRGSRLEVALDQGEIKTGRRLPVHEVEVELKRGKAASIVALGREISDRLKAGYGVASKAERGYALREGETGAAVCATDIILRERMTAAQAFQAIAMSCVRHFAGNRGAVIAGDAEGVHQMRVGLRRLRAAISIFKEMLRGPETETMKEGLKWLTGELGPARDMDVLAGEGVAAVVQASPVPAAARALKADIAARRDAGFERARRAVTSERYRRLVLDVVLWINGGRWNRTSVALIMDRRNLSASRFAAQELGRRNRKALRKLARLDKLTPLKRHKLRIAVKKLRYASGYFASLFADEKKAVGRFSAALKELQSCLGQLNDIRVHRKLAKGYAASAQARGAVPRAFAMGELAGEERARSRALLKAARRRGKKLARCPRFWI